MTQADFPIRALELIIDNTRRLMVLVQARSQHFTEDEKDVLRSMLSEETDLLFQIIEKGNLDG